MHAFKTLPTALLYILICIHSTRVNAQIVTDTTTQNVDTISNSKKSYFKLSLNYLSNAVYYGRKDSLVVPYITPAVRYENKSGLYLEASLSYLPVTKESRIDLGTIGAGYIHRNIDTTLKVELYANKYFTSTNSYSVKSALKADAGLNMSFEAGSVTFIGEVYTIFSGKTDITTGFGLSYNIEFGNDENWSFSPTGVVNAGTSNFYKSYFTDKKFTGKRRRVTAPTQPLITPIVIKNGFGILDYELSAPLEYEGRKFGFYCTPTYSIPVNPISYSLTNGLTYKKEKLTNSFYVELGVFMKIW